MGYGDCDFLGVCTSDYNCGSSVIIWLLNAGPIAVSLEAQGRAGIGVRVKDKANWTRFILSIAIFRAAPWGTSTRIIYLTIGIELAGQGIDQSLDDTLKTLDTLNIYEWLQSLTDLSTS
jgi:hypothetical protein